MSIEVTAIHHVGIVVTDLPSADAFYGEVLGFRRHHVRPSWFILNASTTLHLIPLGDPAATEPPHHAYRHVALQVPNLRATLQVLLEAKIRVFQAEFGGGEREVNPPMTRSISASGRCSSAIRTATSSSFSNWGTASSPRRCSRGRSERGFEHAAAGSSRLNPRR